MKGGTYKMFKILTDTSALYNVQEGKVLEVDVLPLTVTVQGKTYREFEEIDTLTFHNLLKEGHIPTSSQPAIGETIDYFEKNSGEEILALCMADGLSGTYASTVGAKESINPNDHIHVVNTKTLCGPHRYLIQLAVQLREEGKSLIETKEILLKKIDTAFSFLMPQDFNFLRRGGRCTALAATLGGLLKLQPVVTQTEDGRRLDKFTTGRSMDAAVKAILVYLNQRKVDAQHKIYICHGYAEKQALKIKEKIQTVIQNADVELLLLSCAFLTQGGPGAIAIQVIEK